MKKLLTSSLIISSIVLTPTLRAEDTYTETEETYAEADAPSIETEEAYAETDTSPTETEEPSEGTPVGQAANEGTNTARKKRWQNVALAAGAVAVAVTALILVASNDGHHHHHKSGD